MAAYKTGRSRTLTISGTISGKAWQASSGKPPRLTGNAYELEIAANWITDNATKLTAEATALGMSVSAETGLGDTDSDSDMHARTSDTTVSGTYSISVDLEEWVELTEGSAPPSFGGTADSSDMPGETIVQFTERYKVGGELVATIMLTDGTYSVSATATDTLTTAGIFTRYDWSGWLHAEGLYSAQTARVTWSYHEFDVPAYSKSGGGATIAAGSKQASVTVDASADPHGTIRWNGIPPQGYILDGSLRTDNAAYTSECVVRIKRRNGEDYVEASPSGGAYSSEYTQQTYSTWGDCDGVAQDAVVVDEHTSPIYHWLVPNASENANQWRLMLRGAYYDAGTIMQATTVALDGGFAFGDSGATRTLSPAKSMAGYRYLVVATDQAAKAVTLTIGNKEWTVTTTAAGLAIFDLCGPGNLAVDTDARDSRWPVPTDVDTVTGDGCMWGVVNVGSLTLTAEAGVTCTVPAGGVYLSRDTWNTPPGHSLLNAVAPHVYWVASGAANTYKRPFLRGDTDGRRSLDEADWTRVVGVPTTYTPETIEGLFDAVNAVDSGVVRNPGWTATLDAGIDVADGSAGDDWEPGFLNRNRNASWVEGSGIAYVNGAWRYALDVDVSSAYTLVAQMLADRVGIYPMCGDVFGLRTGAHRWEYGSTAEEGRAELRGGRYMRGVACGLTLTTGGLPADGCAVTYKRTSDGLAGGAGTSDLRGEYLTGLVGGLHGETYTAQAQVGDAPFPAIEELAYGGLRRRCCFAVTPGSLGCIECDGPRQWLHVGYGQRVRTYDLWSWAVAFESDDYAISEWIRFRTDPRRGSLLMLSDDGGGIVGLWLSYDGGMTATEVDTMTASSAAIETDSERGACVLLWENGGNVQVQVSADGGATWSAAQTVVYGTGSLTGTIVDMARDARRDILLLALSTGGAISVYGSQDLGLTWQLVAS